MGSIKKHLKVKLVIGFIFKEDSDYNKAKRLLEKQFGKIDFESQALPFLYTDYYKEEFGSGLKRKFVSFKKLILPQSLPKIKHLTNRIELVLCYNKSRRVNIDPGYLELDKLILASTKDYAHRIYLDKDIYAEITLFYKGHSFLPCDWTYPDYRTAEYIAIFNSIRTLYAAVILKK
jgi:hypothetical protein